jgi:hypothetical protein
MNHLVIVPTEVILKGPIKGLSRGSSPNIAITLSASSSKNILLLHALAASAT